MPSGFLIFSKYPFFHHQGKTMEMLEGIVNCIYSSGVEDGLKTSAQDKCQESTISFVPVMLSQSQECACLWHLFCWLFQSNGPSWALIKLPSHGLRRWEGTSATDNLQGFLRALDLSLVEEIEVDAWKGKAGTRVEEALFASTFSS